MSKQFNLTVSTNRTLKLISEVTRYFRQRVALDLAFQSESRWEEKQSTSYMTSLITGMAPSKIVVANIPECLNKCVEGSNDYDYFKKWQDKGFEWISIDGNNRTITIDNYLKNAVKLKHGEYCLPDCVVVINENNDTYDKHPKPLLRFIEENVSLTVSEYVSATRTDLSSIFQNVNDGIALNAQELRNSILVPYAEWVRNMVKDNLQDFKSIFKTDKNYKRRDVDEFVVSASIFTTYGATNGVTKLDRDSAYDDDSAVSKQTKNVSLSLNTLCKIIGKHATPAFKDKSTLFNLYMLIDTMRKNKAVILNEGEFFKWFMTTELDRLKTSEILVVNKKSGEQRNFASCCTTTSKPELAARLDYIMEDFKTIDENIAVVLDPIRIFTPAQRHDAWVKQKGVCLITGLKIPKEEINNHEMWAADHIKPHSKGGRTVVENCQLIQKRENLKKGNKMELGEEIL